MKRSSYLQNNEFQPIGVKPVKVWGYDKKGKLVCRVEINGAGIAVFSGPKARKKVADLTWERFVDRLDARKG
jgi:hypothetical protein